MTDLTLAVRNDEGLIALRSANSTSGVYRVRGIEYFLGLNHDVGILWCNEQNIDYLMQVKKECCTGNKQMLFRLATQADLDRYNGV